MNEYTASNGLTVEVTDDDRVHFGGTRVTSPIWFGGGELLALREFFQHERDVELGRWRWPASPEWVVYPDENGVIVLNETDPSAGTGQTRSTVERYPTSYGVEAARAYFEAHPERKAWHDAKPGETWLLTTPDETDVPAIASSSENGYVILTAATHDAGGTQEFSLTSVYITEARRIWPEDAS